MVVPHLDAMNYKYVIDSVVFVNYFSKEAAGYCWLPPEQVNKVMSLLITKGSTTYFHHEAISISITFAFLYILIF